VYYLDADRKIIT